MMKQQTGFTLIEMLIVVAIILILAAITIPCLMPAKIAANEASAVASIRAINTAELSYQAAYGGYAAALANLGGAEPCTKSAATACVLDQSLAGGTKSGYILGGRRRSC
jgi:type IV pilus assembly protein PilA